MQCVTLDGNYIALGRQIVQPQKWKEYTGKSFIRPHSAHPLKRILLFLGQPSLNIL